MKGQECGVEVAVLLKRHLTHGQISRQRHLVCSVHIPSWGSKSHPIPEHTPGVRYPGNSGVRCDLLSYEGIVLCLFLVCNLPI